MSTGITINLSKPHEAILAANEADQISENDRLRIVAAAEKQVEQHRQRVLTNVERDRKKWEAEADEAHDILAKAEVEIDRLTKRARDGLMTSAELTEALAAIDSGDDGVRAALRRLDRAEQALERISRDEADPYGTHLRIVSKYSALNGLVPKGERSG